VDTCFSEELNETEQAIIKTLTFLRKNAKSEIVLKQTFWKLHQGTEGYCMSGEFLTKISIAWEIPYKLD